MEVLRKYNAATSISFPLIDAGTQDFEATPVAFVPGDCKISKDGNDFANTDSVPSYIANGIYTLSLTGPEMTAARVVITIIDQDATKLWEDQCLIISTYGHTSAAHAFDLGTATQSVTATTLGTTAKADVRAEVDAGLLALNLDHLLKVAALDADVVNDSVFAQLVSKAFPAVWSTYENDKDSLEAIKDNHPENFKDMKVSINTGLVTVGTNQDKTGYNVSSLDGNVITAGAINSDAITSAKLDGSALNAIADAILKRDWTLVTSEADRSMLNALRLLRNKHEIDGVGTLHVKKEDDSLDAWTAGVTTDPAADPITAVDPT